MVSYICKHRTEKNIPMHLERLICCEMLKICKIQDFFGILVVLLWKKQSDFGYIKVGVPLILRHYAQRKPRKKQSI